MRYFTSIVLIMLQLAPGSRLFATEIGTLRTLTLAEALELSGRRDRPVLIEFWATWCRYCKELQKTLAEPGFEKTLGRFIAVRVDYDKNPRWVSRYEVQTLPTLLVVDHSGSVISRSAGRTHAETLYKRLENSAEGYLDYLRLRNRPDASSQAAVADYLLRAGNPERAIQVYEKTLALLPLASAERDQTAYSCALAYFSAGEIEEATRRLRSLAEDSHSAELRRRASVSLKTIHSRHN